MANKLVWGPSARDEFIAFVEPSIEYHIEILSSEEVFLTKIDNGINELGTFKHVRDAKRMAQEDHNTKTKGEK